MILSARSLNIYHVRHVPVINPNKIWYGANIDYDDTSANVRKYFKMLAESLPNNPDTTLWISSTYPRAKATGDGVLSEIKNPKKPTLILSAAFIEQQYGVITDKRHEEVANHPTMKAYLKDMWDTPLQDGESMKIFQTRVGNELDHLVQTTPPHITDIVIFSHGGVAIAAFSHASGHRMIDVFKARKKDNPDIFVPSFSYQSNLLLRWSNGAWQEPVYESGLSKHSYRLEKELL